MQRFSSFRLEKQGRGFAVSTDKAGPDISDIKDLVSRVRFAVRDGHIWLDHQRMFLFHAAAYSTLRREICDMLGFERARQIFVRVGHVTGVQDAQVALRVRQESPDIDVFLVGPQLHMLEGIASVEPISVEIDAKRGQFDSEFVWRNSIEAEVHIAAFGIGSQPVCWCQTSHASGYTSHLMNRAVEFREIQCVGQGDTHCRIVGRTIEQWETSNAFWALDRTAVDFLNATPPDIKGVGSSDKMIGRSANFASARELADRVAKLNTVVLLRGETGVGKERFAQAIHKASTRANQLFHAVNCAALPETLLEAELFGVERGAYTGATNSRPGWFESCGEGTLLLDEIGSISANAQSKLLRVIQEREFVRVGSTTPRTTRARLIFATSEDLETAVLEGKFRRDLLYRINTFPIQIPPLRERRDDILLLLEYFLAEIGVHMGRNARGVSPEAVDALLSHQFPGNIRELESMVERALILVPENELIQVHHLFSPGHFRDGASFIVNSKDGALRPDADPPVPIPNRPEMQMRPTSLREMEIRLISEALRDCDGNVVRAAQQLGLSRSQLRTKIARLKIKA